jgi:hypothetical protein
MITNKNYPNLDEATLVEMLTDIDSSERYHQCQKDYLKAFCFYLSKTICRNAPRGVPTGAQKKPPEGGFQSL